MSYGGVDYKIWLISAQVIGYMLSKFIGIKVISEMSGQWRSTGILLMSAIACTALAGFAIVPAPWNIVFLFLNGLPLGMGWGLMLGYLEGRKTTEVLGAGLSVSFIFSSGFSKSIGKWVMDTWQLSEFMMPVAVAGLFVLPLLFLVWLLGHLPPPSGEDERLRTRRSPMDASARLQFVRTFAGGLLLLILSYVLLTIYREFRDNYAAEIWQALGHGDSAAIFTASETPVALLVMLCVSLMMAIKNNRIALMTNLAMVGSGFALIGLATWAFQMTWLPPIGWMVSVGLGLYLSYVPFNSVLFDRLIAAFRYVSNVGFLIYLADSFGYLGSIAVLFYKNFGHLELSWAEFFLQMSYIVSFTGVVLTGMAMWYFYRKKQ
jgi:hypothetical protein